MKQKNKAVTTTIDVVRQLSPLDLVGKEFLIGKSPTPIRCMSCYVVNSIGHSDICKTCKDYSTRNYPNNVFWHDYMIHLQFYGESLTTLINVSLCDPSWEGVELRYIEIDDINTRWEKME